MTNATLTDHLTSKRATTIKPPPLSEPSLGRRAAHRKPPSAQAAQTALDALQECRRYLEAR
jgi:hypothetical protein